MTNGGLTHSVDSGLLGVEIGRNRVRLVLLDRSGSQILAANERPIEKAGGPRDPIEQEHATRSAIDAGLDRLKLDGLNELSVGVTIGFPNCGVGSGPALQGWLDSLSEELDEPVLYNGHTGISYAPLSCVEFVQRVFDPIGIPLDRVELAPVSAARILTSIQSGAITLGSGVAWSARLLNGQVLEAFEAADGSVDAELHVMLRGVGQPIAGLDGFDLVEPFGPGHGISSAALAPSVGVAVALLDPDGSNLLDGAIAGHHRATDYRRSAEAVEQLVGGGQVRHADVLVSTPAEARVSERTSSQPAARSAPRNDEFGADLDDLTSIQDELRAHRLPDDTHRLRGLPRTVERSRELRTVAPPLPRQGPPDLGDRRSDDGFERIEDFAHPDDAGSDGFHVSDFLLGALLMLAIMLIVALVVL